jgi:hypothetical protein
VADKDALTSEGTEEESWTEISPFQIAASADIVYIEYHPILYNDAGVVSRNLQHFGMGRDLDLSKYPQNQERFLFTIHDLPL